MENIMTFIAPLEDKIKWGDGMKYKKKPVVIEAVRYMIDDSLPDWFMDRVSNNTIITHEDGTCHIKTLEGIMKSKYGDYIILGVNGEVYPCKPDIFQKTYEEVLEFNVKGVIHMLIKVNEEIQVDLNELIDKRIKENVDNELSSYDFEDAYDTIMREEVKGVILSKVCNNNKIEVLVMDEIETIVKENVLQVLSEVNLEEIVTLLCKELVTQKLTETLDIETIIKKLI